MLVMVVLAVVLMVLCLVLVLDKVEIEDVRDVEQCFTDQEVEVINDTIYEKPKKRKSAFIEWDDEDDSINTSHTFHTQLHNKIKVTLKDSGDEFIQSPPTECSFKVNNNMEGVEFLCSCIETGNIETLVLTMYELSTRGDTGEIYQYLDERFNLSQLLFDYTY